LEVVTAVAAFAAAGSIAANTAVAKPKATRRIRIRILDTMTFNAHGRTLHPVRERQYPSPAVAAPDNVRLN
jgi:hypothetical protein